MKYSLTRTVDPAIEPVTLNEAKNFLRVSGTSEDTLIKALIKASREKAEAYLRRSLITQTYRMAFDGFEGRSVNLPMSPLQSVTSITTYDDADTGTVFSSSNYFVDADGSRVKLRVGEAWPYVERTANGVEIVYVAGYGSNASDVPDSIKTGMQQLMAHWFENREAVVPGISTELPLAVRALWDPYRVMSIAI